MAPPTAPLNLDVEAISGICGSISIACWVVVFSPQILENFRRSSAEGLSVQFIVAWLLGDVFNVLGAVLQGVLPTMVILAVYYTIADFVLLGQCFYYRGFTWRDDVGTPGTAGTADGEAAGQRSAEQGVGGGSAVCNGDDERDGNKRHSDHRHHNQDERTALLATHPSANTAIAHAHRERRGSDWSHLSPVVPLVSDYEGEDESEEETPSSAAPHGHRRRLSAPTARLQSVLLNGLAVLMVCAAGVAGWWLSRGYNVGGGDGSDDHGGNDGGDDGLALNLWGQVFGWLCAALYLGSRLPQLLLNWRRKSTEGVSMLFFLFACLGNLTYVLSICAFAPRCAEGEGGDEHHHRSGERSCAPDEAARLYGRYLLVNLSWLAGSAGTLLLDLGIFAQFFMYGSRKGGGL